MSQAAPPTPIAALPSVRFKSRETRRLKDRAFVVVCIGAAFLSILALVTLLTSVLSNALGLVFDEGPLPYLLLGIAVFGLGAGGIGSLSLAPSLVRGPRPRSRQIVAAICGASFLLGVVLLAYLWAIRDGQLWLTWSFFFGIPSRFADQAGIWPATVGTIYICAVCAVTAIPIGVATAILLEEYRPQHPLVRRGHAFVQLNITNLAGVPSIVYGILGLTAFVQVFNAFGTPLDPAFSAGVQWYDRFVTEGGEALMVPVEGNAAEPTRPADVEAWVDAEGEPIDVEVVSREAILPRLEAVDARVEAFEARVRDAIDDADAPLDVQALGRLVSEAWGAAGLLSDAPDVRESIVSELVAAQDASGRDRRRLLRTALGRAEAAERAAAFPGVLLADAYPSRVSETRPWYFRLPLGRGVLAGGLTLMLVVLPIIIISSQEALRSVPRSMRHASLALGATRWQTVWKITLPTAIPGIMTGTILAMSRAIGEAAPILVIAGIVYITYTPSHLMDDFTAMPLQIFNWAGRPQEEFRNIAAAGIIILMAILLTFNAIAVFIRQRTQKQY